MSKGPTIDKWTLRDVLVGVTVGILSAWGYNYAKVHNYLPGVPPHAS